MIDTGSFDLCARAAPAAIPNPPGPAITSCDPLSMTSCQLVANDGSPGRVAIRVSPASVMLGECRSRQAEVVRLIRRGVRGVGSATSGLLQLQLHALLG